MDADLVLEGGGVKGIGLAGAISVLEARGYAFRRVGGTSAGAIVGALVASGLDAVRLEGLMREVDYGKFQDKGFLDKFGHLGQGLSLLFEKGIYEGDYLRTWLTKQLGSLGVRTFRDLRLPNDGADDLPESRRYKLVVMTSDVSRGQLVRLPWDYAEYGLVPDDQLVADAIRASMSIPFFFEPVKLRHAELGMDCYLVDGGALSNFPIDVFDRTDGRSPRWPTFGIKLSAKPDANQAPNQIHGTIDLAKALIGTMSNAHDQMHIDDPCVQRRTIFVDTGTVKATDFDLHTEEQTMLYDNGLSAATNFLDGFGGAPAWDFERYIADCRSQAPLT
jgi:NTE family protein